MNATRRCASARKAKSTNARCEDIPEPHLHQGIAQQQRLADPKVQQVTESEIYAHHLSRVFLVVSALYTNAAYLRDGYATCLAQRIWLRGRVFWV